MSRHRSWPTLGPIQ